MMGCSFPGSVRPTIKVGLSAPFEGRGRDVGYQALWAARLAVRQRNEDGGVGERFLVELVALNDFDDADEALLQAYKMTADGHIVGVLGGFSPQVALRVGVEYERLGLAFLSPGEDLSRSSTAADVSPAFSAEYEAISGGVPAGEAAIWAYETMNRLLDAVDASIRAHVQSLREGTRTALESNP
jgi:ABC-type branched-subunit amino acid transport system substrate-binding protein